MGFFDGLEQKMKNASEVSNLNGQIRETEKQIEKYYYDLGKLYFEKLGESPAKETEDICKAISSGIEKIDDLKKQVVVAKGLKLCPNCGAECPIDVPFCSSCGSKLPMPEPVAKEEPAVCFCSSCGNKLDADAAFCPSCGTAVGSTAPAVEEPAAEEPVVEEPVVEEPVVEEPVVEEPVIEEPVVEEPVAEEPVAEEPVAEEPVAEEPVVEEPAEEPIPEGMKKCASCGAFVVEKALFCGTCGSKF